MTRGTSGCASFPTVICSTVLSDGRASIVTDTVTSFTEDGVKLGSGVTLGADLIVTATGLRLQALGGIQLVVDGREVSPLTPPCTWARCCPACPTSRS